MARAVKSRVLVELDSGGGQWVLHRPDMGTIQAAESWIRGNIQPGTKLRAVRVSGEFESTLKIMKR